MARYTHQCQEFNHGDFHYNTTTYFKSGSGIKYYYNGASVFGAGILCGLW